MKIIITPLLLLCTSITIAQVQDLAPKSKRLSFTEASETSPAIIAAAKIKTEKVYAFYFSDLKKEDSVLMAVHKYNEQGEVISSIEYSGKLLIKKLYTYTYHPSGMMASKKIEFQKKGGHYFTEITYNEAGHEEFCYNYADDSTNMFIMKKEYGLNGKCNSIKYLDKDGIFKPTREYSYTENGNLAAAKIYTGPVNFFTAQYETGPTNNYESIFVDSLKAKDLYYDNNGNLLEESRAITVRNTSTAGVEKVVSFEGRAGSDPFYTGSNRGAIASGNYANTIFTTRRGLAYGGNFEVFIREDNNDMLFIPGDNTQIRTVRDGIETKKYFYNTDGSLAQITVSVSGNPVASIKHFYQTE